MSKLSPKSITYTFHPHIGNWKWFHLDIYLGMPLFLEVTKVCGIYRIFNNLARKNDLLENFAKFFSWSNYLLKVHSPNLGAQIFFCPFPSLWPVFPILSKSMRYFWLLMLMKLWFKYQFLILQTIILCLSVVQQNMRVTRWIVLTHLTTVP